jgi:hypothetical protein
VVSSGAGLVPAPPPGPAQVEGEAGAGEVPFGVLAGEADQAGGLGDGEPDGAGAGRAGLPGPGGDRRVAERDARVGVTGLAPSSRRRSSCPLRPAGASSWPPLPPGGAGGRVMSPQSALRMAMSRSWARAARAVCRPVASQVRAWHWSQPSTSFPVLNVCSIGHLRPAMVMKNLIVAGWSCGAQHR